MKKLLLTSVLSLTHLLSNAGQVDFREIVELVIKNVNTIQKTQKNIETAFANEKIQQAGLLPTLKLNGDFKRTREKSVNIYSQKLSLDLNYNVFNGGKTVNSIAIAKNNKQISILKHKKNIADVVLLLSKVYYGTKKSRILKKSYTIALKNSRNIMRKEKIKFENGQSTKSSYLNAQSNYYNLKAKLESISNNIIALETQYYTYTGTKIPKVLPNMDLSEIELPETMELAIEKAKKNNLNVQIAKIKLDNANYRYKISLAEHSPVINAYSSAERKNFLNEEASKSNSIVIGTNISVPLFSGGADIAKNKRDLIGRKTSQIAYSSAISTAELSAMNAWKSYSSAKIEFDSFKKSYDAIKMSLQAEKIKYDNGRAESKDLLDLQDKKLQAEQLYISGFEKQATSTMELLISVGDLTRKNLEKIK